MSDAIVVGLIASGSTLAGIVVSSGVQMFVAKQAHKQQMERDKAQHARELARNKAERLMQRYERASRAAQAYHALSRQVMFLSKDESVHALQEAPRAFDVLEQVVADLALEGDNADVIALCDRLEREFHVYVSGIQEGGYKHEALDDTIEALRKAIQVHLAELETPQ